MSSLSEDTEELIYNYDQYQKPNVKRFASKMYDIKIRHFDSIESN
jgi:hypothetical protein